LDVCGDTGVRPPVLRCRGRRNARPGTQAFANCVAESDKAQRLLRSAASSGSGPVPGPTIFPSTSRSRSSQKQINRFRASNAATALCR
jgi:hypothetical protein